MSKGGRPIRVCLLINQLAPGGAPTLLLELVEHTASGDVDYTVCFIEGDDSLASDFEAAGVRVVDLGAAFKFDLRAMVRFYRLLREGSFDILHTHLPYADTLGRVIGRLAGVPDVVSTKHNFPGRFHPVTRALEHATRPIDTVTAANSRGVMESFVEREFRRGHEWRTIYNGIDVEAFSTAVEAADPDGLLEKWGIEADDCVVLNVARYNPAKGQAHLAAAAEFVVDAAPDTHVLVVGWGGLEADLKAEVRKRGLEDNVSITGRVPSVHEYYALADLFVLPSTLEGFGIVLLEAMAASLPVVASDIPGVKEVVADGETGRLVPPADPEALASTILEMRSIDAAAEYGRRGHERALKRFDIETVVEAHVSLYRELVAERST